MATKETFYIGDNPTLIFESRKPDPYRFEDPDGLPANPIAAEYRLYNRTDAELFATTTDQTVFTMDGGYITLEPANEEEDRGAIIKLKFHEEIINNPGAFTLYVTSIFEDGTRITDNYRIDIVEYR